MASTPNTSFSSSEESPRGRATKQNDTYFRLPSPQQSDCSNTAHEITEPVYQAVWDHFRGLPTPDCPTFLLPDQGSFEYLYERLEKHPGLVAYFEDEIRKDWDAETGRLILRFKPMALPIHDCFKENILSAIDTELDRIAREYPALQPLRTKIIRAGHSFIRRKSASGGSRIPDFEKSPDGQMRFTDTRYPPFLLEVAYSQRNKDLLDTVNTYFDKLPGRICTILGVTIPWASEEKRKAPSHFHSASVCLWTSELQNDDELLIRHVLDAPFRSEQGQALAGDVSISFEAFLPLDERSKHHIPPDAKVRLEFSDLANFIHLAEKEQRVTERSASPAPSRVRLTKVRFVDTTGTVTRQENLDRPSKRRRSGSATGSVMSLRSRTRSESQPRRSDRIRSRSRGRPVEEAD